jgi:hypothetical protein
MIKKSDLTPDEAINARELCHGRLCDANGVCDYHLVNISSIEDRTIDDVRLPRYGSVVLVDGYAMQSGCDLDGLTETGFAYHYDLQLYFAGWESIALRSALIYEPKDNESHIFGSPWRPGMPVA